MIVQTTPAPKAAGDPCEEADCPGHLYTYCTRLEDGARTRFLRCNACGKAPPGNKWRVPLASAPRKIRPLSIRKLPRRGE
jgi:hypothetical protein